METPKLAYDLHVKTVHEYNAFVCAEDLHPLVSVIHYDELPPIRHCRALWEIFGVFFLGDDSEQLSYGSGGYDYSAGSIVCVSPSQIGGVQDDGTTFQRKGWALLFDPDLFSGKAFAKELGSMEFFHYHVNRAIVPDEPERKNLSTLLAMLRNRITVDKEDKIIEKFIELILTCCSALFAKQHPEAAGAKNEHIVTRLERFLNDYYASGQQAIRGIPTVGYCAGCLCRATNYLGDLIRKETGDSAKHFIDRYVVSRGKDLLMSGKSVTETSDALGFNYPSHFARLFKRIEHTTPKTYTGKK